MASSNPKPDLPSTWKEFEESLAAGENVESLLGLEEEITEPENEQTDNKFQESLKVTIGGEEFKMEMLVPTLEDVMMISHIAKEDRKPFPDVPLAVPPPVIPFSELLPLHTPPPNEKSKEEKMEE